MAGTKTETGTTTKSRKRRLMLAAAVLAVLGGLVLGGYFYSQTYSYKVSELVGSVQGKQRPWYLSWLMKDRPPAEKKAEEAAAK